MLDELTLEIRGYQNDQSQQHIVTVRVLDQTGNTIALSGDGKRSVLDILKDGCSLFTTLDVPVPAGQEWKELLEVPPPQAVVEVTVGIKVAYSKSSKAITPLRFPGME